MKDRLLKLSVGTAFLRLQFRFRTPFFRSRPTQQIRRFFSVSSPNRWLVCLSTLQVSLFRRLTVTGRAVGTLRRGARFFRATDFSRHTDIFVCSDSPVTQRNRCLPIEISLVVPQDQHRQRNGPRKQNAVCLYRPRALLCPVASYAFTGLFAVVAALLCLGLEAGALYVRGVIGDAKSDVAWAIIEVTG